MSSISFFQLSLEEKKKIIKKQQKVKIAGKSDWRNIEDCCNSLERLRAFQLGEILGKYKLF